MIAGLERQVARYIIEQVGSAGQPPEYGFHYFSVGLERYLDAIRREYLEDYVRAGGSAFKMVVGEYGLGKTHFLYALREAAWALNYVVSYIRLSPNECPFHSLDRVYAAVVRSLMRPQGAEQLSSKSEVGIDQLIKHWFTARAAQVEPYPDRDRALVEYFNAEAAFGCESVSFERAVKSAFKALLEGKPDRFELAVHWLLGEGYVRHLHAPLGILQKVDRSTAFPMLRSLIRWVRGIGFSGLVVLMDEAERLPSLSSRQRELLLNNLRELIDECGTSRLDHSLFVYAVPDETFLEGRTQIYEGLNQRLATVFNERLNPVGVKIYLDRLWPDPVEGLVEVGRRLARIYEVAYGQNLSRPQLEREIRRVAEWAHNRRFASPGHRRTFVLRVVRAFRELAEGQPVMLDT